jgi:hypothetical protein
MHTESVALLFRIPEVPGPDLAPGIAYLDWGSSRLSSGGREFRTRGEEEECI